MARKTGRYTLPYRNIDVILPANETRKLSLHGHGVELSLERSMSLVYDWVWTYAKLIGFLAATTRRARSLELPGANPSLAVGLVAVDARMSGDGKSSKRNRRAQLSFGSKAFTLVASQIW